MSDSELFWYSTSSFLTAPLAVCVKSWGVCGCVYMCMCTGFFMFVKTRQIKSLYLSHDWMRNCFVAVRGFGRCLRLYCQYVFLCMCVLYVCVCTRKKQIAGVIERCCLCCFCVFSLWCSADAFISLFCSLVDLF